MRKPVRVDYAAEGHGSWLSLELTYPSVPEAVRAAQLAMQRWEPCVGFRVVYAEHPIHEKMDPAHFGKMVNLANEKIVPPSEER